MRAWLVRADGGRKLEEFRERSYTAIRGGVGDAAVDEVLGGERREPGPSALVATSDGRATEVTVCRVTPRRGSRAAPIVVPAPPGSTTRGHP
jgi:hypothetical protein